MTMIDGAYFSISQRSLLICFLLAILPGLASAAGGIAEINQVCAVSTGCFPGDAPGFPVQISNSGSYALTGDLVLPDENTNGIEIIDEDGVSIDLAGFTIRGPGLVGTGNGIISSVPLRGDLVRVRNGSIIGVGAEGVSLKRASSVVNVTVENPGATGIAVSTGSMVVRSRVDGAGGDGIEAAGSMVLESHIRGGAGIGIRTFSQALILGSSSIAATGVGLSGNGWSGFADNFFIENLGAPTNSQVGGFWIDMGGNFCRLTISSSCP